MVAAVVGCFFVLTVLGRAATLAAVSYIYTSKPQRGTARLHACRSSQNRCI